ncbi:MAG: glycosyltransferase involved in cell wall biosynthesis [Algoriphagus sp.]
MMNSETPLVSVCIPTFQHYQYISQCIDSVLDQKTNFLFEIILGEDQSNDGTREICKAYAVKFPEQIRLFLRKDEDKIYIRGRKSGRSNYLENFRSARGKYIAMLDGDDCWIRNDKLQNQVNILEAHPEAFFCSTEFHVGEQIPESPTSKEDVEDYNNFQQTSNTKKSYSGHVSNWLFRNELEDFLSNPIATKAPILDMMLFSFFKKKGTLIHLQEKTSFYRVNKNSYHIQKGNGANYKDLFWSSWYQFIYLHRDPKEFMRFIGYLVKKIIRDRKTHQLK